MSRRSRAAHPGAACVRCVVARTDSSLSCRYNSVYVPSAEDDAQGSPGSPQSISYDGSVFSDTYIMYESKLLIPTHVLTYHLEVDPVRLCAVTAE